MPTPLIDPAIVATSAGPAIVAVTTRTGEWRITCGHQHARGQLLGAFQGLLSVHAGGSDWVVPATHAVWIPPAVVHAVRSYGPFAGWSVYVAAPACAGLPPSPCVLAPSPLLHESILRAATWLNGAHNAAQIRLSGVILDEISSATTVALGLPMPTDPRLRRIAQALSAQPGDGRRLEEWAQWAAIAPRTLTRRFALETGFNFTQWRQRLRLLRALEMLAVGKSVTMIALDLGYENVSAFIALFKRLLGTTPGQYVAAASTGLTHSPAANGDARNACPAHNGA
jgi:AraC-like DNA-binding protein